tara:strand:- start:16217 stop:16396 length:180 start_codon:yes stop_codon:yes gene_type:complete
MPTTVTDLLNEISTCVKNRDTDRLEDLRGHVRGWMQTEEESESQLWLLEVVTELLFENE